MTTYTAATRGVPVQLLLAQTTDETTSIPLGIPNSFHNHKVAVTGSAGVASGVVTIETAPNVTYSGTWSKLTDITVVALSTIEYNFTGVYAAIRTRISTAIGSGTVDTEYLGS